MRLLQRDDNGEFSLMKDLVGGNVTPPYAILSYTWGADTEDITFEDIIGGTGKVKQSFKKFRFCKSRLERMIYSTSGLTLVVLGMSISCDIPYNSTDDYRHNRWI
jgi:hypothetical protein